MVLAEYQSLKELLPLVVFSLITGTIVMLQMLWKTIVQGPRNFFRVHRRPVRPEVLDDPSLGTHHIARLKAIKLHYVAKGNEDKPVLLCLHGFPEFWYSWRYQLKEFSDKYRVVALDMRGYSESDKPVGVTEYTMDKLVADVKAFIEHLGHKRVLLAAHDWGGAVAWGFAAQHPDMVEKLIVCNIPHLAALKQHLKKSTSQAKKSWYISFFQIPILPELFCRTNDLQFLVSAFTSKSMGAKSGTFSAEDIEAYKYTFQNFGDITGPINYYRALGRYKPTMSRRQVQCPTLVVWGTGDGALEKDCVELSRKFVDGEYVVKFLEGTSHWVQQEEPEQVNNYIREFLEGPAANGDQKRD